MLERGFTSDCGYVPHLTLRTRWFIRLDSEVIGVTNPTNCMWVLCYGSYLSEFKRFANEATPYILTGEIQ